MLRILTFAWNYLIFTYFSIRVYTKYSFSLLSTVPCFLKWKISIVWPEEWSELAYKGIALHVLDFFNTSSRLFNFLWFALGFSCKSEYLFYIILNLFVRSLWSLLIEDFFSLKIVFNTFNSHSLSLRHSNTFLDFSDLILF